MYYSDFLVKSAVFASRTTGVLRCAKKWDTTVVLIASSFLALFIGAIFQPIAWMDMVQSAVNGFKDTMLLQFDGIASDPLVAKILWCFSIATESILWSVRLW